MKISVKNLQKKLPVSQKEVKELVRKILAGEKRMECGYINICFVDDGLIREFNARFLKENSSTDVLAFNLNDKGADKILLADIMISSDTAINNARKFNTDPGYELMLYIAHGVLHILGYDDKNKTLRKKMRKKELQYVHR